MDLISGFLIPRLRMPSLLTTTSNSPYSSTTEVKVLPALEKLATVFEVSISEFFKAGALDEHVNLPLLEKVKLIDQLEGDEKNALLKMIDIAISKKRMKDNLSSMING